LPKISASPPLIWSKDTQKPLTFKRFRITQNYLKKSIKTTNFYPLQDDQPFIRVLHRNDTATDQIFEVQLPGCSTQPCPLVEFNRMASQVIPENWAAECDLEVLKDENGKPSVFFLLCEFFLWKFWKVVGNILNWRKFFEI
jgi:hypothetical protein